MDRTAPHSARTDAPASNQEDRSGSAMPACIAAILAMVRSLLGYGKHLDATLPEHAEDPRFPALAAGFGTHDLRRILAHVQRGILRAMMLQKYLLARAAQGRDIAPIERPSPAEPADIEAMEMKLPMPGKTPAPARFKSFRTRRIHPDDPLHFAMPTLKELESQVRRRSIGRTIAEICKDLGVTPSSCEGAFWHEFFLTLTDFGGDFEDFFGTQERRKKTFEKERQTRRDTLTADWRDRPREAIRALLGYVLGESPQRGPPIPQITPALS